METVKVDLLVIGDIACSTYMSCAEDTHITCAANRFEISATSIPDSVVLGDMRFNLKNAIVMDAKGGVVEMTSIFAPSGKAVFATGEIFSRGIGGEPFLPADGPTNTKKQAMTEQPKKEE